MKSTWRPQGSSDPLSYTCTCSEPGQVLLFYRYFASPPALPTSFQHLASDPANLSNFHVNLTRSIGLKGKIRIAKEGFNITVGGSSQSIKKCIEECIQHWSFAGLELDTDEQKKFFFKPSPGCACVLSSGNEDKDGEAANFQGANVRICEEITPMGVSSYVPKDWDLVESLSPAEFHERLCVRLDSNGDGKGSENVLVDVRNHYESRIGYFMNPLTGEPALRPQVRRFGQWPQFVKARLSSMSPQSKEALPGSEDENNSILKKPQRTQYITYCTGGIRCEKGSRFLAENLASDGNSVCTLRGGIQAYLMWMDEEIKAGRKTAKESLFKGKNYVFDARGSTGLSVLGDLKSAEEDGEGEMWREKVATCHVCGKAEDRLSKCRSKGCHLILVVCEGCEEGADPRCCESCLELDTQAAGTQIAEKVPGKAKPRPICECEKEREFKLWGERSVKSPKPSGQGRKRMGGKIPDRHIDISSADVNIRIKTFS